MSSILFNVYSNDIIGRALEGQQGCVSMNGRASTITCYTDDTTITATSPEHQVIR